MKFNNIKTFFLKKKNLLIYFFFLICLIFLINQSFNDFSKVKKLISKNYDMFFIVTAISIKNIS